MSNPKIISAIQRVLLLVVLFATCSYAHAQINRGDYFFEQFEYAMALEAYEYAYHKQNNQSPLLSRKMALTHRMLGNMKESEYWYNKTIHRDKSTPLDYLHYAEALKYSKNYEEAMRYYVKYNKDIPSDSRAVRHMADPDYVHNLSVDSIYYRMRKLEMNTDKPAFGITKWKNDYLISYVNVINPELGDRYLKEEAESSMYMDVYIFRRQEDNELKVEDWLEGGINSMVHDGPVSYDAMHDEMIVTRNNMRNGKPVLDAKGKVNLKLFVSKWEDGMFQPSEELPFNSDEFSNAHPALSRDGKTLYFSSNRDGGVGETDIYFCERTETGWTAPINMGPTVNTEGEETFPYVDERDNLYFASTGHAGLGGLDLFRTKRINGLWTEPVNMGAPINSNKDDFGLCLDDGGESGYLSSNRSSKTIDDDIYFFEYHPFITLRGHVEDAGTLLPLDNALVRIYDEDGNLVTESYTDVDGLYDFEIKPKKCRYTIEISNGKDYSVETLEIEHCDQMLPIYDMGVSRINELKYMAIGTIRDAEAEAPIAGFKAELFNAQSDLKLAEVITADDGFVEFKLKSETDYKVAFSKEGWFAKSAAFTTKGMDPGVIEINKYVDLLFDEIIVNKAIEVENIFYDLNKFFVREDAKPELDKLVKMMTDNPSIVIELSSHTDSQGRDDYNEALSEQRAKAAVDYIMAKGISANRIKSKGYGETQIRNRCTNGVRCSDKEHEYNRRTEFKVLEY